MTSDHLQDAIIDESPEGEPLDLDRDRHARRQAVLRAGLVVAYLVVVFGILLPSIVDYGAMVDAFLAAPPEWLALVFVVGVGGWFAEGLALKAVMVGLGIGRAVVAYLVMAAIGSTLLGPVKLAMGYRLFRDWGYPAPSTVLALTINGLAAQASKLLLPAVALLFLTVTGAIPAYGIVVAFLLFLPLALGVMVGLWVLRSEAFARRVGAFATRATDAVMRRIHRSSPDDLTDRLLDFRESARDLLLARVVPITLSQLLARTVGYVLLLASMRAVGVDSSVLGPDVILAVYAVVMVITLLPIAPGGAGLPELLYISLFTQIVADPAMDDAIAAGVMLFRGMSWFLPIPVGYVALLLQRRAVQRAAAADPERTAAPG